MPNSTERGAGTGVCEWIDDGITVLWETSCGKMAPFEPYDLQFKFCPYCGNPIKAYPYTEGKYDERP